MQRIWPNLLLNGYYFTSLSVSAMFFLASQRLCGARWSAGLRRIPEALMMALPVGSLLMLAVCLSRGRIYPELSQGANAARATFLNPPFVYARMAATLLLWTLFAGLFRRASLDQDRDTDASLVCHRRQIRYSIAFVLVFAVSFTVTAFDWIISLYPSWFSTLFAIYVFAGTFVQGIAAITLGTILLRERGLLTGVVTEHHLHDLGKMLFAFSTFWAYIWTCQYLLIWYANIPEEITPYVTQTGNSWLVWFLVNFLVNWLVPFLALLSVRAKRNPAMLKTVSIVLLAGHWLDLYLLITPPIWSRPAFGWIELVVATGCAALFCGAVVWNLTRAPLVPLNDPILAYAALAARHGANDRERGAES
jgi:hypothetical protein